MWNYGRLLGAAGASVCLAICCGAAAQTGAGKFSGRQQPRQAGAPAASQGPDGRTGIPMTAEERDFIHSQMREFLAGVLAINEAALDGDREQIAEAAAALGHRRGRHAPPALRPKLPPTFRQFGSSVHASFDEIADMAATAEVTDIQRRMNEAMHTCLACHATYRVDVVPPEPMP